MEKKLKAGIIGATGYVGQRFVTLLDGHPWFEAAKLAASAASAGKSYEESVSGRWKIDRELPEYAKKMPVYDIAGAEAFCEGLDFVFCAVNMKKEEIRELEEKIARLEVPVVSNNSALRGVPDVPVIIPELNFGHSAVIEHQRKRLGTKRGFVAAKPNCSIQSYVPALFPLTEYGPREVSVCTYQAISGAGKKLSDAPEVIGNIIPYIGGEEEKSEQEPLKIWGGVGDSGIIPASLPLISAQCYRVGVAEGHIAAVSVKFERKPALDDILAAWKNWRTEPRKLGLPSAPEPFIRYMEDEGRPQPALDAGFERGMGISVARLREDSLFDYKFVCLSHNTIRGAAGGAVLTAELLKKQGWLD
ncbi:MAG: aspartate-semialdehyde dehydrogenase [Clostridiales bacterium]|jgi:aspartate-semialdehyde dehydrogenase|nr:aspartate-semialdehyde dehydrogenase [Clostridiales bacterium]